MTEFIPGISLHNIIDKVTSDFLVELESSLFAGVELHPRLFDSEQTPEALRSSLLEAGVKPLVMHVPFGRHYDISAVNEDERRIAVNEVVKLFPLMAKAGTDIAVVHTSFEPIPDEEREVRLNQACMSCLELQPFLDKAGFRLAVELLPRSCIGNSSTELLKIISDSDPTLIGVCIDTNHLMENYAALPEIVTALNKRIFSFHISDYDGIDEKHWVPGKGVIDWQTFKQSLEKIGYCGPLICECKFEPEIISSERLWKTANGFEKYILNAEVCLWG